MPYFQSSYNVTAAITLTWHVLPTMKFAWIKLVSVFWHVINIFIKSESSAFVLEDSSFCLFLILNANFYSNSLQVHHTFSLDPWLLQLNRQIIHYLHMHTRIFSIQRQTAYYTIAKQNKTSKKLQFICFCKLQ